MPLRASLVAVLVLGASLALASSPASPAAHAVPAARPAAQTADPVAPETMLVPVRAEPDGTGVKLDVSVWPQRSGRHPVVLLAHGFGGTKDSVAAQAAELNQRGYVVVTWSARGHGRSGGRIHLNDPAYEVADAKELVTLAAQRPDVELDAPGDPRVGVMGGSYGGALALMLAGADARVDGVVAAVTWNDLADAFFPQAAITAAPTTPAGRTPVPEPGPFKQVWATNLFLGAQAGAGDGPPAEGRAGSCGRFDPTICRLFVQVSETGVPSPELLALLHAHSPKPTLAKVFAPAFLVQGVADSLFGLDQADATARALNATGTPYAVRWSDGGHDAPSTREREETDASYAWLDHWVRDQASHESALPTAAFTYFTPPARRTQPTTLWTLPAYPGLQGSLLRTTLLPLTATSGVLLHPPGGQPACMVAVPRLSALGVTLPTYQIAALPGQSAAFDTAPLADAVTVVGSPTMSVRVTSDQPTVTFFASFWRVSTGQATLPNALVAPVRVTVTPGKPTPVTISLPAATYPMPVGSRWRVLLTATESTYANDRAPGRLIVEATAPLTLPVAEGTAVSGSGGRPDTETVVAASLLVALLLLSLVGWLLRRRRRLHIEPRPDLADVPLVVDGLVKTYSDGHRAVDDVSWRAEKGQVVGLLGPNGAGKTTTMRMIMGLISSDAGTVHVLGEPVTAGAPVLARVGALVEGPGFLPHLTGRQNLEAYWTATGRPREDAHVGEALEVAALGNAVDRPVKSYSHGMKQRLGIAQAMLGLPELLILDEPTNGLDPPQIAAMRPILRRYADTGRTVVISSHLLAEVEMTCTHVVVMHAGRVVTQGLVADLVDSDDTTLVDVEEGVAPARLADLAASLESVPGISQVRIDTPTRLVVVAELGRAAVVEAAVGAGLPVVGVSSRRHLEEVFLGVISSASATSNGSGPRESGVSLIDRLRQVRAR
jgi:ABC-2 type transport system ATP-binding protein